MSLVARKLFPCLNRIVENERVLLLSKPNTNNDNTVQGISMI